MVPMPLSDLIFRVSGREKRILLVCMLYPFALFIWGLTPSGFSFFSDGWGVYLLGINPFFAAMCALYFAVVSESRHKPSKLLIGLVLWTLFLLGLAVVEAQCWNAMHELGWDAADRWRHAARLFALQCVPFSFLGW